MEGTPTHIDRSTIILLIITTTITFLICGIACFFISESLYDVGYFQGHIDCNNNINKVQLKVDTTYHLQ